MPSGAWAAGVAIVAVSLGCGGASTPEPAPPAAAAPAGPAPPARRLVRLSYLAPSDCPTVDGYVSYVRARSTSLDLQERGGEAADSVDVRLDPELERPGWLGQLRIQGSRPLEREVHGERCEDVVEALALITVLRLERGAAGTAAAAPAAGAAASTAPGAAGTSAATAATSTEAAPASTPPAEPPAPEPAASVPKEEQPGEPAPAAAPAQSSETPAAPAESAPVAPPEATSPTDAARDESSPAGPVSGAPAVDEPNEPPLRPDEPTIVPAGSERIEADVSSAPNGAPSDPFQAQLATLALLVGYASVPGHHALELTLASELRYGETLRSWTSPIALVAARGNERVDAADLDIALLTAQLGLCPPAPLAESWGWLRPCANVRAGAVHVEVTPRVPQLDDTPAWRPWLALVPSLELGVPLSEHWTIRASAELAVQLVRDTFGAALGDGVDPEVLPLYETELLSVEGALGVGYTF